MNFVKTFVISIILIAGTQVTRSQKNPIGIPSIKNYNKTDYKGGTQNWDIDQDKNGNVYFANENNLLQFDGLSWRDYKVANCLELRSVKVDDNSGRIYVGGYSEFGYFESDKNGHLFYTSLLGLITDSDFVVSDYIWKIHIYKDEIIFQSFSGAYVYKNGKISSLEAPNRFQFSFTVENKLYFQDLKDGILEYKNGFLNPLKNTDVLNDSEIWGIFSLPNQKLLIATLEKGLFTYQDEKITSWNTEANTFIKQNGSLGGVLLSNNKYVLNSVLSGIIVCDLNGKIIHHIDDKKGLQNNTVLKSFKDDKNGLWLGLDNGITFVNINSPFTFLDSSYNLNKVYASVIHEDILYAATNQGVFYHEINSSFLDTSFTQLKGISAQSWNIQIIDDELICSNNNGAFIITEKQVVKKMDDKGYYGFKKVPSNPNFIIGANYGGFSLFEKTKNGLKFVSAIEGFSNSTLFFELDNSFLWLLRDQQLYKMKLDKNYKKFTSVEKTSLLNPTTHKINSLQKIKGKVHFESNNQFYIYDNEKKQFNEELILSTLFSTCPPINYVKEDTYGNLWYMSGERLGVYLKDTGGNYKNSQTIFSNLTGNFVTNYLSINASDPETFFIGTATGLAKYKSKLYNNLENIPKVFLRSFMYAKDTIMLGNLLDKKRDYIMPYSQNNVKFTFSSPEFENSENLTFSYMLESFDSEWSNWSSTAIKEYTNLREGNYKMNLKAKNSFGKESNINSLNFIVTPPWYRHYFAYISYVLLLALAIRIIYVIAKLRYRKREYYKTIEQRKTYLEKESKIRKKQYILEKQVEKLNRDKLQIKIRAKDKELVNNSLQVVKKNEILNSILQKLNNMEENSFNETNKNQFSTLKKNIVKEIKSDNSWKDLEKHIKNVHFEFLKRLKEKCPAITPRELDLSTFLLINMSTKEIAEVMKITIKSVEISRYRLRKKLKLDRGQNLTGYLLSV